MAHVSLHRCRFVDYPPRSITSLGFSHSSSPQCALPPPKTLRLAVGRSNGSIEIWNPLTAKWHHEMTLQGGKDRSIESVVWTQDYDKTGNGQLRLFSIGSSSVVTEWDLSTSRPTKHLDCNGGAIWSIAAQPRISSTEVGKAHEGGDEAAEDDALSQKIAIGTDDGTLKVLSTAGGPGQLEFINNLMRAGTSKARVLSLVWKDRFTVVAGMADSSIRVWDVRSGRCVARMSVNRERGKEVLVWTVKVLKNGDIVSGDSRGEVCFWSGANWTLKQRIRVHDADCLTLEVGGVNGDSVISGGADMRTVLLRVAGKGRGWVQIARRRFHKHDVRAMAAYESGSFSVVASGGVDMTPIIIPFRGFTVENHRTLPLVPSSPILSTVPEARVLMSCWEREVKIWRIEELSEIAPADFNFEDRNQGRKLLSHIILENEEYITSASIYPLPDHYGYLLAVSTIGEVKLFFLRTSKKKGSGVLRVQKISIPDTLPLRKIELENDSDDSSDDDDIDLAETGARLLRFSPNGKQLLVITPDSKALLVNLSVIAPDNRKEKASVNILPPVFELQRGISALPKSFHQIQKTTPSKKRSQQKQDEGTLPRGYLSTVVKAAFSSTSQLLAIADLSGNITTFSLQPTPFRITASIPRLSSQPVILSFRPVPSLPPPISTNDKMDESSDESSDEDAPPPDAQLLAITADTHSIHLFSAASGRLAPWSKRNPMPSCLPADFAAVGDRAVGAFWESGSTDRLWCHGASWVWMFDFSRDWPNHEARLDSGGLGGKRKRGEENAVPAESISGAGSLMQIPMVPSMAKTYVTASEPKPKSKPQSKHKTIPDAKSKGYENHENERSDDENDDDDDDEIGGGVQLTRVNSHKKGNKKMGQKPFWGSFRYRSLLGVLPVGEREAVKMLKTFGDDWGGRKEQVGGVGEEEVGAVEIVIVERPLWDVGLPPRFYDGK